MSATNEIIEKCARALCAAEGLDPDGAVMHGFTTMRAWESREPRARAVLQTLMTPTDEMVEAGEQAAWDHDNHMPAIRAMLAGWTAMLSKALEGEGK